MEDLVSKYKENSIFGAFLIVNKSSYEKVYYPSLCTRCKYKH